MSKSINLKAATRKAKAGVAAGPHDRIVFTRLENVPIIDATHEKVIFERGEDARKLNPQQTLGPVIVSSDVGARRIIEVYRLCYERAAQANQMKVVSDFVGKFPHLVFEAEWLKGLVRELVTSRRTESRTKEKFFAAVANGFRRAARSDREPAIQRRYREIGASHARQVIQAELSKWNQTLERTVSTPDEIASGVEKQASGLDEKYPMALRDRRRLRRHLQRGQLYEAAILISSRVFHVRERDLESRPT